MRSWSDVGKVNLADRSQINVLGALLFSDQDVNIVTDDLHELFRRQITCIGVIVGESEFFLTNHDAFMEVIRIESFKFIDLI